MTDLIRYLEERNRALVTMDMGWARREMPHASSDEVRLVAMHKTRMHITGIDVELRLESIEWLRERGYNDLHAMPLPPKGQLP